MLLVGCGAAGALLIVPYGIETSNGIEPPADMRTLLIVPYGIETSPFQPCIIILCLLIVPYGIETGFRRSLIDDFKAFNRTLWN